ncbi:MULTISPECIES: hypothetical protein [unclassified Streptomyces]|uniref:hypothetical protein n=1 Tax=unclassified Streptomyces TaxID=2593676 RepID=UPI0036FFA9AD
MSVGRSPAQALEHVRGLLGGEAPARLVAVAVEQLVVPVGPVLAVGTVRPGKPGGTARPVAAVRV